MKRIHLIGIGGSGLSAIARLLLEMGYAVTGSDRAESPFTQGLRSAGVTIHIGHCPENIAGADLVVRSSAVSDDNPEVVAARAAGIPVLKRADFLGNLMEGKIGVAVAGTHGKTTITSMIAWMLTALDQDPSFISGSLLANLGANAHAGKGKTFVIEADEYDRMFLGLKPDIEVVTSVEHDHPDCYPTPADYQAAFVEFVKLLPADGTLIASGEDAGASILIAEARKSGKKVIAYGVHKQSGIDVHAESLAVNAQGGFSFEIQVMETTAKVALQVPGEHNVGNALAALTVAKVLDLPLEKAAQALGQYRGAGRRFEIRGEVDGITLVDDYAHHPTEIRATLAAARSRYPGRRLWAVWQPHTYSRTQMLFEDFARAFSDADEVLVTEIYAAREARQDFSSKRIAEAMSRPAHFAASLEEASHYLLSHLRRNDVVLVLSAGDADSISVKVLAQLKAKAGPGLSPAQLDALRAAFGKRMQENVALASYTSARIGGPADVAVFVHNADELAQTAKQLWEMDIPFALMGGGSNVLVSDRGLRGVVILNRARKVEADAQSEPPTLTAESGATLNDIAQRAARLELTGFEWAASVPGSLGGAVYGNAGAFQGEMSRNLVSVELIHRELGRQTWTVEQMEYGYRTSLLKREHMPVVILSAKLVLSRGNREEIRARMEELSTRRKATQPHGASMGSMFKNPPGDKAGRLIEAAGLKGTAIGAAQISNQHANFFINTDATRATDMRKLIELAQQTVFDKFGIRLELEIELIGEW